MTQQNLIQHKSVYSRTSFDVMFVEMLDKYKEKCPYAELYTRHILLTQFSKLCKILDCKYHVWNKQAVYCDTGVLGGVGITPYGQRTFVTFGKQIKVTCDFFTNYSLESLLYKLWKHKIITTVNYCEAINAIPYKDGKIKF